MEIDLTKWEKTDLILVCGLPGSGKSFFARKHFGESGRKRINRKEICKALYEMTHFGEAWKEEFFERSDESLVKHIERALIIQLLHEKSKLVIDSTSVTRDSRKRYINIAMEARKSISAIYIDASPGLCVSRNHELPDPVPDIVISNLAAAKVIPAATEGFRDVAVIGAN